MDKLKFEVGDFIKDMYKEDFLEFCEFQLELLRDYMDCGSYIENNVDTIERVLYDDFIEATFCIKNDLEFIRRDSKYANKTIPEGVNDLCVVLDIDGLDVTVVYEEGNIVAVEYQTSNGNVYDIKDLLKGYIEKYDLDRDVTMRTLCRLTLAKRNFKDTEECITVKEMICYKLSVGDFSDLEIHGLLVLDNVFEGCQQKLCYDTEVYTEFEYEEPFEVSGVSVDNDKEELYAYLEDVENLYKEDDYEYIVQGILIVDCKRGTIHREKASDIEKHQVEVIGISYEQRCDKVVPRAMLDTEIGKIDYVEFNSVAELLKSEFVEYSKHTVTESLLYGVIPLEENTNSHWGILNTVYL